MWVSKVWSECRRRTECGEGGGEGEDLGKSKEKEGKRDLRKEC